MIVLQVMFSRGLGGLERAFLDHATLLCGREHVVHCIIADEAGSRPELERLASGLNGRLQVHPVSTRGWGRLLLRLRLKRLLQQVRPDVIVAHGAKPVSRLFALRPGKLPLVAITHNASPRLLRATHLIALTAEMERIYVARGFPPQRIHRAPNVLPTRFRGFPQPRDKPVQEPPVVGVLARLVPKKGVDVFLRGLRIAMDRGTKVRAIVGGDGPSRDALLALRAELRLDECVEFVGWLADPQDFYRRIDLLCVPSRDEPFGIVVLEGFAHGTPVLAAAVGGPRELIQDGINGLLFESDNPADLATKLAVLADLPALGRLREAAYRQLPQYHAEAVAVKLEAALQAAIQDLRGDRDAA